jgi:hypothetical protein
MREVRHDLGVLYGGAGANAIVAWAWFLDGFEQAVGIDQQVQPLADVVRVNPGSESWQSLFHVRRYSGEEPFGAHAILQLKVIADLYRIGKTVCIAQIPAVRGIEARMTDRELQEAPWFQYPIHFSKLREYP